MLNRCSAGGESYSEEENGGVCEYQTFSGSEESQSGGMPTEEFPEVFSEVYTKGEFSVHGQNISYVSYLNDKLMINEKYPLPLNASQMN